MATLCNENTSHGNLFVNNIYFRHSTRILFSSSNLARVTPAEKVIVYARAFASELQAKMFHKDANSRVASLK